MPSVLDFGNIWKTLKEVDLGPIRAEAERMTWIAIVGDDVSAREQLAQSLCAETRKDLPADDASRFGPEPLQMGIIDAPHDITADLIVLLVDLSGQDVGREWNRFQEWNAAGKKIVTIFSGHGSPSGFGGAYENARGLSGSVSDRGFLETGFAAAVVELLPERTLGLARYYPIFRRRVVQDLIGSTAFANANYALTTGLAEAIPILDIPFNVADIVILTKNQAIMAYKLGLALGLSPRWQDHMAAFGGTVGTGFLWRQVARQLIGLIPVWGLVPKVAVAYAGTYVLGQAIDQWYVTGRGATPEMMRRFYRQALEQGKVMAQGLVKRMPRKGPELSLPAPPQMRRLRMPAALHLRFPSVRGKRPPVQATILCPNCGAANPPDNKYCANCGARIG